MQLGGLYGARRTIGPQPFPVAVVESPMRMILLILSICWVWVSVVVAEGSD